MGVNRGGEHSTVLATTREDLDAMLNAGYRRFHGCWWASLWPRLAQQHRYTHATHVATNYLLD